MKLKKIYVEITNSCNLNCDFCIQNGRKIKFLNKKEFEEVLDKISNYTNYIYMHVLGEPLMHPHINEFIDLAKEKNINVNITSNGYLIKNIKYNKNIRQINISLHSYDKKYGLNIDEYLENIFDTVEELIKNQTEVSLRLWVKSKYTKKILNYINIKYNVNLTEESLLNNTIIKKKLYLNVHDEFIWPDLKNNYYREEGKCYALRDHVGILVDGTIIPCCLDSMGIINLGNIYKNNLEEIIKSERAKKMIEGFMQNKKCEELCKHCKYL